jgi:hypothetical protein
VNDSELNKLLKSAKVPEPTAEHWKEFPGLVVHSLGDHHEEVRPTHSHRRPILAWGFALATCLVIGFVVGHWRGTNAADGLLQNAKVVREVIALFPNQVQAIIQDENGLRLMLAETPNVAQSQPLWIKVCEGKKCRSMVTFSGQMVQIDGQRVEALADAAGGVMLVGDHFFWSSEKSAVTDRLHIAARQLNQIL